MSDKAEKIAALRKLLDTTHQGEASLAKWLRRPESSWKEFDAELQSQYATEIWEQAEIEVKYEGYIARQADMVEKTRRLDGKAIPSEIDYSAITGMKNEARQKLDAIRPSTLGQAGRISGITPADISLLAVWLEKRKG